VFKNLEVGSAIDGLDAPGRVCGDLNKPDSGVVRSSRNNFTSEESRLRELAIAPDIGVAHNRDFFDNRPFSAKPVRESAFNNSRLIIANPPDNLRLQIRMFGRHCVSE
jgi:hypothetical protein